YYFYRKAMRRHGLRDHGQGPDDHPEIHPRPSRSEAGGSGQVLPASRRQRSTPAEAAGVVLARPRHAASDRTGEHRRDGRGGRRGRRRHFGAARRTRVIGLDTNVLVRYLAQDDPVQSPQATEFIERRLTEDNPGFVGIVAMVETVWVLDRSY